MKKLSLILMLLLLTPTAFAWDKECKDYPIGEFEIKCPATERIKGDWLKMKVFTDINGTGYCDRDRNLIHNCSYYVTSWIHPNVVGAGLSTPRQVEAAKNAKGVPEFEAVTAALAIMGTVAGLIVLRRK